MWWFTWMVLNFLFCKTIYDALILRLRGGPGFLINWKKVVDLCQQLLFLGIQINTIAGHLTLKPGLRNCQSSVAYYTSTSNGSGYHASNWNFGGKIVLGQPCRVLGSHPPQINICVNFILEVTNPQEPPW